MASMGAESVRNVAHTLKSMCAQYGHPDWSAHEFIDALSDVADKLYAIADDFLSEKGESDPLGEQPTYFEMARTRNMRKTIADIVATHDAFVADSKNPARAYELRDAIDRARAIGLTRAEMMGYQDYDCPHAAPHRYCETCKVDPCPLGFKNKHHRSNERVER